MGTQVGTSMKIVHSLLLALSLAGAAVSAQATAPAAAPAAAPTVTTAPAPVIEPGVAPAAAPGATDAKANPPAYVSTFKPDPHIGQPEPGGWKLPVQVTPTGERALWMHNVILMPVIVIISLFVLGLLLWVMFRFRAAANPIPGKTTHNTFIEVVWTLVPVLILVAIAVPSISLLAEQFKTPPKNAVTIKAIGNQWYWTYEYPDNGGFELTANMLKEKKDAAPGERFRTDADGVRLLDRQSCRAAGRRADPRAGDLERRHPQLGDARLLGKAGRRAGPDQPDELHDRAAGPLLRPMLRTVRRASRLHADHRRGGLARAVRRVGRLEGRHDAGCDAAVRRRRPRSGSPCRRAGGSARSSRRHQSDRCARSGQQHRRLIDR